MSIEARLAATPAPRPDPASFQARLVTRISLEDQHISKPCSVPRRALIGKLAAVA